MALCVFPYRRDAVTGELIRLEVRLMPPRDELAGTEANRTDLWGSEILRSLGCEILPRLSEHDLQVEGTEREALRKELKLILNEVRRVSAATEYRWDYIEHRVHNVLVALAAADVDGGGVCIQ